MSFHVAEINRILKGPLASSSEEGNNGAFLLHSPSGRDLHAVASDGLGWEHVSVSVVGKPKHTPSWPEMCYVKALFWDDEDVVIQIHPRASEYVNYHRGCLHLWRPVGREIPTPDTVLVGPLTGRP